jgi:hypothetical protein
VGKILRLAGDTALVFFAEGGPHNGLGKNPLALSIEAAGLELADIESHPRLDHLPPLQGDSVTGGEMYVALEQGIDRFLSLFPEGFHGQGYENEERGYKWNAHREAATLLARDALAPLLSREDYQEISSRALRVIQKVNLLFPQEQMALRDGLKSEEGRRAFSVAVFELLHGTGPYETRFTQFTSALSVLPQKQAPVLKWPVQTILPFLYDPTRHMFLKPQVTRQAAHRCAFDLKYDPQLNWTTYSQLLHLCKVLFHELKRLKPRDYIDLQSFIWCIGDDSFTSSPKGSKLFKP